MIVGLIPVFNVSFKSSADTGRDIYSYYSIPYGRPTSGELRCRFNETASDVI
jgi:hypothetical protein